jgi:multidrug efflux system membrane fusion protein
LIQNLLKSLKEVVAHSSFFKLALLAILCSVTLKHISTPQKNEVTGLSVTPIVTTLSPNEFIHSLKMPGSTKTIKQGVISSKIQAIVKKINIKQGHKVNKGDLFLSLYNLEIENTLNAAKSNLEHKEAEFKAAQKLNQKKFYSENSLLAAKADLDKARVELQKAENDAADLQIIAPEDGYLEECFVNTGDTVFPKDKLIKFVSKDNIHQVRAYVSEENIVKLKNGMKAKITAGEKIFEAVITGIATISSTDTRNFYVELDLKEHTEITQFGTTVQVEIFLEPTKGFWINASALTLNDEGELGIKVLKNNVVDFQPVPFWQLSKEGAYIESDLSSLDVIIYGGEFLNVGQKVANVQRQETPSL